MGISVPPHKAIGAKSGIGGKLMKDVFMFEGTAPSGSECP